jgi:L-2-hydroxyglutarate oxidase
MTGGASLDADLAVVGGGIVGLATARALCDRRPGAHVVVLEKEDRVAVHQSGHNSGVLHSGLYYRPGSEKARLCHRGRSMMLDWCRGEGLPLEVCGKVVVATEVDELGRLEELRRRGRANGVGLELLGPAGLADVEPHARGLAALHVPGTGVVDFAAVCRRLAEHLVDGGAEIRLGTTVTGIDAPGRGPVTVHTSTTGSCDEGGGRSGLRVGKVVNCAGLWSDRVAGRVGTTRIIAFRGEYHTVGPAADHLVRHLIYPVPDPRFPFLGVHLTRGIDGSLHAGPNAVLALGREAYRLGQARPAEVAALATDPATWRLAARYWSTGAGEVARSASIRLLAAAVRRLVPGIGAADLRRSGSGVRAQAVTDDGRLLDDFAFAGGGDVVHVLNAPSPGATASLAIGEVIADRVLAGSAAGVG